MKKAVVVILIVLLGAALFQITIRSVNDHIAGGLEKRLLSCPLPQDTELLESVSVAGKMLGAGNGMQWFGILLVRSGLSADELTEWYRDKAVPEEAADEIYVFKQESASVFGYSSPAFRFVPNSGRCYQIRLCRNMAVGTEGSFWKSLLNSDLRGH